jgi:hypothetical protein
MSRKIPPRDPWSAYRREVVAERRIGKGRKCICGESRPEALIPGTNPVSCAKCDRIRRRRTTNDDHHPFGRANNPLTLSLPVNDHRADLSAAQNDWPRKTLANEHGSPLLASAAAIRGYGDLMLYLAREHLLPAAEILELLDTKLERKHGKNYGKKLKLTTFETKSK